MDSKLKLTWIEIENYINNIYEKILESSFRPDILISVGRGGMIPTRLLSDALNISKIHLFEISKYTGVFQKGKSKTKCEFTHNIEHSKVLIIDDILDTGETFEDVINHLKKFNYKESRTCSLLVRGTAVLKPSYYGELLEVNDKRWIVFPWEKREFK